MEIKDMIKDLARGGEIISSILAGTPQVEAGIKPKPESWSILEVLRHLYDEEREDFRAHLDQALHRPTEAWKPIDPQGWVMKRNYNSANFGETLESFMEERSKSLAWLRRLVSPDWKKAIEAPFGIIQAGDLLAAWVAHDNLHIRQLVELRYGRIVEMAQPYAVTYAGEW